MAAAKVTRGITAIVFGVVGLIAGFAHVASIDMNNMRLMREVLPLGFIVGLIVGWLFKPRSVAMGSIAAFIAIPLFAIGYGVAETLMAFVREEIASLAEWPASIIYWTGNVLGKAAVGGVVAIIVGGAAGALLGGRKET